jgi:hypothetical protein
MIEMSFQIAMPTTCNASPIELQAALFDCLCLSATCPTNNPRMAWRTLGIIKEISGRVLFGENLPACLKGDIHAEAFWTAFVGKV